MIRRGDIRRDKDGETYTRSSHRHRHSPSSFKTPQRERDSVEGGIRCHVPARAEKTIDRDRGKEKTTERTMHRGKGRVTRLCHSETHDVGGGGRVEWNGESDSFQFIRITSAIHKTPRSHFRRVSHALRLSPNGYFLIGLASIDAT